MNMNALEEYKITCEFIRHYALMRYYRLAVLMATMGAMVSAIISFAPSHPTAHHILFMLRLAGLAISLTFTCMDYGAGKLLQNFRTRANALTTVLQFEPFPVYHPWNPLTVIGAGRYLHVFLVTVWFTFLVVKI
jgi:hypothetical protein